MAEREKILTESGLRHVVSALRRKILLATGNIEAEGEAPLSLWRERTDDGVTVRGSVDLSAYETKAEADSALGDLDAAIGKKQDKLTAGDNISISSDNVISATGGGDVDLSGYQKKLNYYSEGNQCAYIGGVNDAGTACARIEVDEMGCIYMQTGQSVSYEHTLRMLYGDITFDGNKILTEADVDLSGVLMKDSLKAGDNVTITEDSDGNTVISAGAGDTSADRRLDKIVEALEDAGLAIAPAVSWGDAGDIYAECPDSGLLLGFNPTLDAGMYDDINAGHGRRYVSVYSKGSSLGGGNYGINFLGECDVEDDFEINRDERRDAGISYTLQDLSSFANGEALYFRYTRNYLPYTGTGGSGMENYAPGVVKVTYAGMDSPCVAELLDDFDFNYTEIPNS